MAASRVLEDGEQKDEEIRPQQMRHLCAVPVIHKYSKLQTTNSLILLIIHKLLGHCIYIYILARISTCLPLERQQRVFVCYNLRTALNKSKRNFLIISMQIPHFAPFAGHGISANRLCSNPTITP